MPLKPYCQRKSNGAQPSHTLIQQPPSDHFLEEADRIHSQGHPEMGHENGVEWRYIDPGKPQRSGFILRRGKRLSEGLLIPTQLKWQPAR